jgi:hypothetical protein
MVLLLLERGAWLSRNYGELLDLVSETGNAEIIELLEEYDVRDLHLKLPASNQVDANRHRRLRRSPRRDEVAMKPATVVRAVVARALILKGTRGKWTGIKGVTIIRAAIEAGMSPEILDTIQPYLGSVQKILDFLRQAVVSYADPKLSLLKHRRRKIEQRYAKGTLTELGDGYNQNQDHDADQDGEPATGPRLSFAA